MLSIVVPLRVTDQTRARNWRVVYNHAVDVCALLHAELVVAEWGGNFANGFECRRIQGEGKFNRSRARNVGWRAAAGSLVCFLDSDLVMPLADWSRAYEAAQKFDAFSPGRRLVKLGPLKTKNRIKSDRYTFAPHGLKSRAANLFGGIAFASREFLETIDGWDERFSSYGFEDIAIEKTAKAGRYRIGWGNALPIHLWHGGKQRNGKKRMRAVYRREYACRTFADILTRRGVPVPAKLPN